MWVVTEDQVYTPSIMATEVSPLLMSGYLVLTSSTIEDLEPYADEIALIKTLAPTFTQAPISKIAIGARDPADNGKWMRLDHSMTIVWTDTLAAGELTIERYATTLESVTVGSSGGVGGGV